MKSHNPVCQNFVTKLLTNKFNSKMSPVELKANNKENDKLQKTIKQNNEVVKKVTLGSLQINRIWL